MASSQKSVLTNHEINRVLDTLLSQLEMVGLVEKLGLLTPEQRASISRGRIFGGQLKSNIAASSDADVILSSLGSIQAGLQNSINELSAFISNSNPAHVDNFSSHLDGAITQSASAFFVNRGRGDRRYGESVANVEQAAIDALSNIGKKREEIDARLNESNALISAQAQAISDASVKINEKIDEGSAAIRSFTEKFDTLSADQRRELKEHLENQQLSFSGQVEALNSAANSEISKLQSLESEAKKIVQIIGNVGVTGNYQKRAAAEQTQANIWRLITIILFAIGIAMVITNLIWNFKGQIDVSLLLVRFAIAVSIALPAIYTARESARHRTNADRSKQTELELASLGPYLETLPTESKDSVIIELSKLYFGRETTSHTVDNPIDIQKLLDTICKVAISKI